VLPLSGSNNIPHISLPIENKMKNLKKQHGKKKLKVGFLIDNLSVSYYVSDLINHIENSDLFETPRLILGYKKSQRSFKEKIFYFLDLNPFKTINNFLKFILRKWIRKIEFNYTIKSFPNYGKKIQLNKNSNFIKVNVDGEWSRAGLYLSFTEEDIQKISSMKLDCIIRCGSGILTGKILHITSLGVISFHHGDNQVNRGGPSGFWEVLNKNSSSGFVIQKLNNELDGGEVLLRGNLMTKGFWLINNAQLLENSNYFLKAMLDDTAKHNRLPTPEDPRLHGNKLFKITSPSPFLKYLVKVLLFKFVEKIINIFLTPKFIRWSIAFANHNNFSKSLWRYKEVKNPKGRYLADPFVFKKDGQDFIFVEDFLISENKGRISVLRVSDTSYEFLGIVLEEQFHLSFPFIFESDGEIFMTPECQQSKEIRLYKCEEFPMKWKLDSVLMKDVSAVDTMIIKKDKTWFMLSNICSAGFGDHHSELHIFYSNILQSSDWQPIKSQNPIIFDSRKARNGGLFRYGDDLYRINQVHSKEKYGHYFNVNKVIDISSQSFEEIRVSSIYPKFKNDIVNTHHFSANEKVAAIDFGRVQRLRKAIQK